MKRTVKRILAVLLTAAMLLSIAPMSVFAKNVENNPQYDESVSVNQDNDFSKLVMSKVEFENSDSVFYGVTDMEIEDNFAKLYAVAPDKGTIVVAVYSEDGKLIGYNKEAADSTKKEYMVSLSDINIPKYYLVKVFILDENYAAVCKEYVNREHTNAFEQFMDLTVDDFDKENVINYDNDKTNNFAVLKDGTKRTKSTASANVISSYDSANDTYVITNADSVVKSLKKGDMLYLEGNNSNECNIIGVKTISVSGNTVKITSNEETVEDVFDCIKINSTGGLTDDDVKNVKLGSALTLVEDENDETESEVSTCDVDIDAEASKSIGTEVKYEIAKDGGDKVSVKGGLTFSFKASVKIYYDAKLFKEDYFEYSFSHEEKLELKITVTGKIAVDKEAVQINVGTIYIPGTPITVELNVNPVLEFEISATFKAGITSKFYQTYNPYDGEKRVQEKDKDFDFDLLKIKVSVKIGLEIELEVKFCKILSASVSASPTLTLEGDVDTWLHCLLDKYHYCDICIEGDIKFDIAVDFGIKLKIGKTEKLQWNLVKAKLFEGSIKLCDFHLSKYNDKKSFEFTKCPNKMYKVSFEVYYYNDELSRVPIEKATISLNGGKADTNGDGKFDGDVVATDKNGKASGYYPLGGYEAKISANGFENNSVHFVVNGSTATQTVRMNKNSSVDPNPGGSASDGTGSNDSVFTGTEATGTVINFGSYPQSKVTDSATISALDSVAKSWKSYNYYSGTGDYRDGKMVSSDYMQYADIKIDGAKYRAVKFTQYRPYCTGYISSSSGSQQDNNGYTIGNTFYFKYEPLKWRVLDASTGFIVCDSAIDSQPYNNYVLYADDEYWGDSNKKYFASNWENSSLRAWLNNEFYNTAFTEMQQNKIQQLTRKNKNKFDSKFDGSSTSDKITLLSYEDILNTKYGFESSINKSDAARKRSSSDYAKCQGINVISNDDNPWLLRTPSYSGYAACLGSVGYDYITYGHCSVGNTDFGIVPALNLSVSSSAPDGTGSNDSVFTGTEATGAVINFGSYPQSKVTDSATISALDGVTKNWKSYNYYSGTGSLLDGTMTSSDYMLYADFLYGGEKYRAVTFSEYRPKYTGYTSSTSNSYQDDNGYYTNNVYYFKYEPLKWRVLASSTGLIVCDSAIDSQAYNNYVLDGRYYWGDSNKNHYASNWEYSSLRAWLNNDFYNTAFSETQQNRIKEVTRENKSTYRSTYDSSPTSDKITLLSYNDVLNTSYGFSSSNSDYDTARQRKSTDYAQCQGCRTSTSSWWLRSPYDSYNAAGVFSDGWAHNYYGGGVHYTGLGIVPVLNLSQTTIGTSSITSGEIAAEEVTDENAPRTSRAAQTVYAPIANGEFTLGSAVDGNRYMVYGVTDYSDGFTLTSDNLVYIDQSEGKDGKVTLTYKPSRTDNATVIVVGDFGSGIEAKKVEFKTGYTVTWNIDGKTVTEIYAAGDKLTPPTVPSKSGYTFKGWDKSVPSTMPANDLTFTAVYEKNVEKKNVKSVSIDDISLNYKKSTTLKPTIKADEGAKYKVEYSTSNAKVATVDNNGKVTATKRGFGTATITCTVTDSNGNVVKDTCKVNVSLTWWQWIIIIVLFGWIWY